MEKDVTVAKVDAYTTRNGNTRYVLRDEEGNEYTTFKEPIARQAVAAEGGRARISFHEQQRDGFTNVYLDGVEPLEDDEKGVSHADEVAWSTAVEAAPLIAGDEGAVDAEELFDKLKPFKDLVAEDIEGTSGGERS